MDDILAFRNALLSSLAKRFYSFTDPEKNRIYGKINNFAGRPDTDDPEWGKTHCREIASRFADALID